MRTRIVLNRLQITGDKAGRHAHDQVDPVKYPSFDKPKKGARDILLEKNLLNIFDFVNESDLPGAKAFRPKPEDQKVKISAIDELRLPDRFSISPKREGGAKKGRNTFPVFTVYRVAEVNVCPLWLIVGVELGPPERERREINACSQERSQSQDERRVRRVGANVNTSHKGSPFRSVRQSIEST